MRTVPWYTTSPSRFTNDGVLSAVVGFYRAIGMFSNLKKRRNNADSLAAAAPEARLRPPRTLLELPVLCFPKFKLAVHLTQ